MNRSGISNILFVMTLLCIFFVFMLGYIFATFDLKKEAVEHHAAYWEVKPSGGTVFHWNDEKERNEK